MRKYTLKRLSHPKQYNTTLDLLIIFLIDVEAVRQTGEKSFYDDVIHSQSGFQAPEDRRRRRSKGYVDTSVCVCVHMLYKCACG